MESLRRVLRYGFEETLAKLPEALKSEGFGVLTEIDMAATLKKRLDADFRPYRIIGACNPPFAKQALEADLEIGRFMPCNVIVYVDDDKNTVVSAIDPVDSMRASGTDPEQMKLLAKVVRDKLIRAISKL